MTAQRDCKAIIKKLRSLANPHNVAGMGRFGIKTDCALGISLPTLRQMGKEIGKNHELAILLWDSDVHETRLLATIIDDSRQVTEAQMEEWVGDFDSWDICDQCCGNLFDKTPFAYRKAVEWSRREEEFVKRAGFALMAALSVHDKTARDAVFLKFLPIIEKASDDDRNFVKKAVNWAVRQIGKRNPDLNRAAIETAQRIQKRGTKSARWIASDALRELRSDAVQWRLNSR